MKLTAMWYWDDHDHAFDDFDVNYDDNDIMRDWGHARDYVEGDDDYDDDAYDWWCFRCLWWFLMTIMMTIMMTKTVKGTGGMPGIMWETI